MNDISLKAVIGAIVGFVFVLLAFGTVYTVDDGERGAVVRTGKLVSVSEPGLHWKLPLVDSVHFFSVREFSHTFEGVEAYSSDQQPATLQISVSYRIDPTRIGELYTGFGTREGLIENQVSRRSMEAFKQVFGTYTALSSIKDRTKLSHDITNAVTNSVDGPLTIIGVQVEAVTFSPAYVASIEARMLVEVGVEKERQTYEIEVIQANTVRERAKARADSTRYQAEADAEATILRGDAEAKAIRARAEALAANSNLVELIKAERWNGVLPTTMLPNHSVPFIEASK